MFGNNRTEIRRVFTEAWRKHRANEQATPLETMISGIIAQHPEYHRLIENPDAALERDFLPEGGEQSFPAPGNAYQSAGAAGYRPAGRNQHALPAADRCRG